jgi:hypothetical protein
LNIITASAIHRHGIHDRHDAAVGFDEHAVAPQNFSLEQLPFFAAFDLKRAVGLNDNVERQYGLVRRFENLPARPDGNYFVFELNFFEARQFRSVELQREQQNNGGEVARCFHSNDLIPN